MGRREQLQKRKNEGTDVHAYYIRRRIRLLVITAAAPIAFIYAYVVHMHVCKSELPMITHVETG